MKFPSFSKRKKDSDETPVVKPMPQMTGDVKPASLGKARMQLLFTSVILMAAHPFQLHRHAVERESGLGVKLEIAHTKAGFVLVDGSAIDTNSRNHLVQLGIVQLPELGIWDVPACLQCISINGANVDGLRGELADGRVLRPHNHILHLTYH